MTRRASPLGHGVALAMAGASSWGLSFLVPVLLPEWTSLEITLGRYLAYGLISGLVLARGGFPRLPWRQWVSAGIFALVGYYIAYLLLVSSIQDIGAAVPALLMGTSPVTVAIYGNLRRREFPFSRLVPSLAAIFAGLMAVNLGRYGLTLAGGTDAGRLAMGTAKSLASLAATTWYLVANLVFLRDNPRITPLHWSSAVGLALGVISAASLPLEFMGPALPPRPLLPFVVGSLVLGLGCSWLGGVFWNKACNILPASLAGQMIVFWPVTGMALAYAFEGRLPSIVEAGGIVLTMAGVLAGIRMAGRRGD